MPRYIDAIKLLKEFQALPCCPNGYSDEYDKARIFAMIDNQPTADVVERKKGKWIDEPNCWYRCSYCKSHYPSIKGTMDYNYCPNCGADMREESDNG